MLQTVRVRTSTSAEGPNSLVSWAKSPPIVQLSAHRPCTQATAQQLHGVQVREGEVVPQLVALQVPVRAVVAPVTDQVASHRLSDAFMHHVAPLVPATGFWAQNSNLYHTTVWHASTHQVCGFWCYCVRNRRITSTPAVICSVGVHS